MIVHIHIYIYIFVTTSLTYFIVIVLFKKKHAHLPYTIHIPTLTVQTKPKTALNKINSIG